jgi:hypothetical protein
LYFFRPPQDAVEFGHDLHLLGRIWFLHRPQAEFSPFTLLFAGHGTILALPLWKGQENLKLT